MKIKSIKNKIKIAVASVEVFFTSQNSQNTFSCKTELIVKRPFPFVFAIFVKKRPFRV